MDATLDATRPAATLPPGSRTPPAAPCPPPSSAPPAASLGAVAGPGRPAVTELRLSAFGRHRAAAFPLGPVTLFAGASGSGKSQALAAYAALSRLASGAALDEVFPDPAAHVPERAAPDPDGRRGFRIGCTVDGPAGPVRLDLAVQAEPALRVVGERLAQDGQILLNTALRDPRRRSVQAAWFTGGAVGVTRAPLPDDRLATALLPLRVAGATAGQRRVLAAAEQVVVALRSVFPCDPRPERMRAPVPQGDGRLHGDCRNLADVLRRTRHECATRHALLAAAARTGCAGPVAGLDVRGAAAGPGGGTGGGRGGPVGVRGGPVGGLGGGLVAAVLDRGPGLPATDLGRLGAGELRFLALALVLLTGPGVLQVEPVADVLAARQALTVLADDLDRGLDRGQGAELLRLALLSSGRGHVRLAAAVGEATAGTGRGLPGVSVVDLVP
ncbi:biotin transporter BioY [Streptomyces lavendulae subsp. lavendulae]|uniref:ATP-binding protein n=1 Tax=Streptomyces lavendulae TaxID=1914 RepID=UPI0024A0A871|nr:ATP-binding protein [Streptomyces lavendulae]GLV86681.1 biotin transporter BioY [Streptomyces lavendulae subsp. lavendulae]